MRPIRFSLPVGGAARAMVSSPRSRASIVALGDMKQESFTTLLIDPVGGGQTMYTLGSENTLWESRDGGKSWRRDDTAPGFVTGAWLSPVDGAVLRDIASEFANTADKYHAGEARWHLARGVGGMPWKRAGTRHRPGRAHRQR